MRRDWVTPHSPPPLTAHHSPHYCSLYRLDPDALPFEANLLASITPLGHATKKWAILGMPLGFGAVGRQRG